MLQYGKIDVAEGIDANKTQARRWGGCDGYECTYPEKIVPFIFVSKN